MAISFLGHKPNKWVTVIDHKDNNKLNNKRSNLQLISNRENTSKNRVNGSSKYLGVFWSKHKKMWSSSIYVNSKRKRLGYFNNEIKANEAYQKELKAIKQKN